jgi:hypothetical protein
VSVLAIALAGGAAYAVVAAGAFWFMVSYEHQGRSGWRSARAKPRGQVLELAGLAALWLPLLVLLALGPLIDRNHG